MNQVIEVHMHRKVFMHSHRDGLHQRKVVEHDPVPDGVRDSPVLGRYTLDAHIDCFYWHWFLSAWVSIAFDFTSRRHWDYCNAWAIETVSGKSLRFSAGNRHRTMLGSKRNSRTLRRVPGWDQESRFGYEPHLLAEFNEVDGGSARNFWAYTAFRHAGGFRNETHCFYIVGRHRIDDRRSERTGD